MSRSTTWDLDTEQSALWEEDTDEGRAFRESLRKAPSMGHVEVISSDGVTLDAWDPPGGEEKA